MAFHRFKGIIRRLFLPHMKIDGELDFPTPVPPVVNVTVNPEVNLTGILGAVEFSDPRKRANGPELATNEIAVVTYWYAELNKLPVTATVHYGPGTVIRETLNADGSGATAQMGIVSGYLIRFK